MAGYNMGVGIGGDMGQRTSGYGGILDQQSGSQAQAPQQEAYGGLPQSMGPGQQYGQQDQIPGDFTSPWIGGYPQMSRKKRYPWQQDYEQPQGGMQGMQAGPGYSPQSAPWLDGNHMEGIMRRGMYGGGQGNI